MRDLKIPDRGPQRCPRCDRDLWRFETAVRDNAVVLLVTCAHPKCDCQLIRRLA